ncbi:MAG: dihydropteroate synthase [Hydrogenophilales bacterium 16-64-46]|nr:MAG: dihydropteroate synthase [Hydrogenophilales bacterium 12-64-13]OYZ04914.1 MAG: dihydropteroate synthase [Hydrogenophilales bacterium 16-64-46]OZA37557.1 MAG: dihydropteroate synthase [Hydrogenophilales bacterium 17-64-34]HQT00826.1 dihydropteroate synthase [Thiobacillus sp.]
MSVLHAGDHRLSLSRPLIMGIVNTTPDSFSDGGNCLAAAVAIDHALKLADAGADILDIGGESTRPGAKHVAAGEEIRRVLPVAEALVRQGLIVSVDTRKPEVMRAALAAGVAMINDVSALREPGALEAVAASRAAICLMHMRGEPGNMQAAPTYENVVEEVAGFLQARMAACEAAGIERARLVIDPGFGFGKTLEHNLALLRHLSRFVNLGVPVLAGLSRKSMLGSLTGRTVLEREFAGVAAHLAAIVRGARIVRVHDAAAMRDALAVWNALEEC